MTGSSRTIAILLVAIFAIMIFVISLFDTIVVDGPTIQIQGHYLPLSELDDGAAGLGTGSRQTLRLTESLIPDHLGQLRVDEAQQVQYRHEAAHRNAEFTRPTGPRSTADETVGHLKIPPGPGARILLGCSETDCPAAVVTAACDAGETEREGVVEDVAWAKVSIHSAEGLWIPDQHGAMHVILVPVVPGEARNIGEATLAVLDNGSTWLLAGRDRLRDCDAECRAALMEEDTSRQLDSWWPASWDEMADRVRMEPGLDSERDFTFVQKPRMHVRVGDNEIRTILPGGMPESHFEIDGRPVEVFRRSPGPVASSYRLARVLVDAASRVLEILPGPISKRPPAALRVARSNPESGSVHVLDCANVPPPIEQGRVSVGEQAGVHDWQDDEWLVAGDGVHYRVAVDQDWVELRLEVPPSGRARPFASLAASRFKAYNPRIDVSHCPAKTVLRAVTDERALPPGQDELTRRALPGVNETVQTVPMPYWLAKQHPDVQEAGHTEVDVASLCVNDEGLLMVSDLLSIRGLAHSRGDVVDNGQRFRKAGHIFRYAQAKPKLEQWFPLLGFWLAVGTASLYATVRLQQVGRRHWGHTLVAVGCVSVLMVVGSLLQMHMSASDNLLGTPDYVHRHLVTGWLTVIALVASMEAGLNLWDELEEQDGWHTLIRVLSVLGAGMLGLALWATLDGLAWQRWGAPNDQVLAGDMVRSGTRSFVTRFWLVGALFAALAWRTSRWKGVWVDQRLGPWALFWDRAKRAATQTCTSTGDALEHFIPAIKRALDRGVAAVRRAWGWWVALCEDARKEEFRQGKPAWKRPGRTALWLGVAFWDHLFPRGNFGGRWLVLAIGIMVLGAAWTQLKSGNRAAGGFDLKPAEFTAVFIGLGFGGMLAGFSQEGSTSRWWVPRRALIWSVLLLGVIGLCYLFAGDLGPLMVIVPAVVAVLFTWVFDTHSSENTDPHQRTHHPGWWRLVVFSVVASCVVILAVMAIVWISSLADSTTELPATLQRTIDRLGTYWHAWYTTPGWWTTRAHWLAAGLYGEGREVYLSNLHSDLAFTALMQTYSTTRALMVLGLFGGLVAALFGLGEKLLQGALTLNNSVPWVRDRSEDEHDGTTFQMQKTMVRNTAQDARRMAALGYLSYFAGSYLLMEVVVHVGTCFNTIFQTGVTLPWISSGGSAAMGCAVLVGLTVGMGAAALRELPEQDEWNDRWERLRQRARRELSDG